MRALAASLAVLLTLGMAAGCGGDDGEEAGEAAEGSFIGLPWVLSAGLDVEDWEATAPSAIFTDTTVGGSTGCNRFTAAYTLDGDSLEIGSVASTRKACPPPADAVENAYVAALGQVAGWRLDGAELVLVDEDDAELLRYAEASPVGDWEVTAFLNGDAVVSPLPGTKITLTIGDDDTVTGSAGCNTYKTTFTTDAGAVEIEPPTTTTKKLCSEPEGVMEQEAAFVAALPTAVRYRIDGGSLTLLSADGTYVASLTPAAQP